MHERGRVHSFTVKSSSATDSSYLNDNDDSNLDDKPFIGDYDSNEQISAKSIKINIKNY